MNPELLSLEFAGEEVAVGFALEVAGLARGVALQPHQFLNVTFSVNDNVQLSSELRPRRECVWSDGRDYACGQFLVGVAAGHDVAELTGLLIELDGQAMDLQLQHSPIIILKVEVFSGDDVSAFRAIGAHPAVDHIDLNTIVHPLGVSSGSEDSNSTVVRGVLRTRGFTDPPHVAKLAVASGDRIVARYMQPDGSILETSAVIR